MSSPMSIPALVRWPLRSLGLESGRALTNARPSIEALRASRDEQHRSILEGIALAHAPVPRTAAGLTDHRALRRARA